MWITSHVQLVLFTTVVARNEKIQLTTKVTKSTKFGDLLIRTLRILRDLRGEHVLTVNPQEPLYFVAKLLGRSAPSSFNPPLALAR